ncbi:MAG: phosphatidylglycerol lysyltransferase domain-containing protein [Eubacteriales bacterium]|nr:phosphatidylglycerol lysyltransferase domain-containing protein [Eubacteriales bacterium]
MQKKAELKPILKKDYDLLKPYYQYYKSEAHDFNLTNLIIWKNKYDLHIIAFDGYLWICFYPNDFETTAFSEPIGNHSDEKALRKSTLSLIDFCRSEEMPLRFRYIGIAFKNLLETWGIFGEDSNAKNHFQTTEDAYDYCYLTEDLVNLSGKQYHRKKNNLNQFQKLYKDRNNYEPINPGNAMDALLVARGWCADSGCSENQDLCKEFEGIKDILKDWAFYSKRGVEGIIIYVDGLPKAFSIGEPLTKDMFLIHIEKASHDIQGIYAAINHKMATQVLGRFTYLNREQDLGIEGLRKAKQAYNPHHMVEKWSFDFSMK